MKTKVIAVAVLLAGVSLFAQELHTPEPISPKRLDAQWAKMFA